jgi:hypothetical protein
VNERLNEIVAEEVNNMPITIDPMENSTNRGWVEAGIKQRLERHQAKLLGKQLTQRFGMLLQEAEKNSCPPTRTIWIDGRRHARRWLLRPIISLKALRIPLSGDACFPLTGEGNSRFMP